MNLYGYTFSYICESVNLSILIMSPPQWALDVNVMSLRRWSPVLLRCKILVGNKTGLMSKSDVTLTSRFIIGQSFWLDEKIS